jgi:ribosome-associated protein
VLEAAAEKKAEDPVALDLKAVAAFTDAFVILGGTQRRQTQAISDAIVERLVAEGEKPDHVEGYDLGEWILIDYADLIVHVFTRDTRAFYSLEKLWGDAPRVGAVRRESRRNRSTSAARKG